MESIKSKIGNFGGFMAIFGALSILMSFLNYNPKILMLVDAWGVIMGWVIRVLLIVVGGSLFFLFTKEDEYEE